jgi:fatty-acyl-CoA synthase
LGVSFGGDTYYTVCFVSTTTQYQNEPIALSYSRGAAVPLIEKNISQVCAATAAQFPDRDAIVCCHQNLRLTWAEMDREVTRVARGLAGLGLKPGDRVGIWASNCLEWVLLQYGTARAGVVLVNVNPAYRSTELSYVLRKSNIRALFLRSRDARADYAAILAESRNGNGAELPLQHVVWLGEPSWDEMLAHGADFVPDSVGPDDVANIQYTSGTTGSPKGVLLTHRGLLNDAMAIGLRLEANETDRICAPVPLYHCFGSVIASLVCLVNGAALILPAGGFDARATLEAVHKERATALYGVPTMYIAEMEHPDFDKFDLTSLKKGIMSGTACPTELMRKVSERMHMPRMSVPYGQTEASPVITMSSVADSNEIQFTTIGIPLANAEVKIIDPSTGATVPVGETGELCARGFLLMKGYDNDPEATAAAVDPEGWLHTGDLAAMRPDGYFNFKGRAKDTIIRGGENIYPREIEDFLHTHPKIADVHVIGIPDAKLGETVVAWVQIAAGETLTFEDIKEFCKGKVAYFKVPQYVRFVDDFPQTITKKVQKFVMREQEIRERGLEGLLNQTTA